MGFMKKLFCVLLAILALGLSACGQTGSVGSGDMSAASQVEAVASQTKEAARQVWVTDTYVDDFGEPTSAMPLS